MDRSLHRLKSFFRSIFEPKKKNPISLRDDENLDSHHKILKVGDKNTPISLKNDAVDVQGDLTVNGVSVSTEPEVGTITALNNATENELVTVGATTTELDAEANLTFDGSELIVSSADIKMNIEQKLYFNLDTYITENTSDLLKFVVGGTDLFQLQEITGGNNATVNNADLCIDAGYKLFFDDNVLGGTYITESSDDILDFYVGAVNMLKLDETNDKIQFTGGVIELLDTTDNADLFRITVGASGATTIATVDDGAAVGHLTFDVDGDIALDSTSGNFIAKKAGTEFSVANSAYAGMILGYRMIGEDGGRVTYTLTTSFVVPDDDLGIRFIAPPSGAVEIMIQIKVDAQASNDTSAGLSSQNNSDGYLTIGATYEQVINMIDESDNGTIQHYWVVTGLTAGDTKNYWVGFKKRTAGIGNGFLNWGGGSGEHCDFIMKATALPTAVSDFAEYD